MGIVVNNLSYIYHPGTPLEKKAVDAVSFTLAPGEWLAVVGHTGSGKSTLVQHLNGLLLGQAGMVEVDGIPLVSGEKRLREVRRRVGFVFQFPEQQLFAENVFEEIAFAPRNWGVPEEELPSRVEQALARVGLGNDVLRRSPFSLSGGQKRRVALASVLGADPSYLVLDEPTAGLDGRGCEELMRLVTGLVSQGVGVVHVTHDLDLALSKAHRILVLEKGRQRAYGAREEVLATLLEEPVAGLCLPPLLECCAFLRRQGMAVPLCDDAVTVLAAVRKLFELGKERGGRKCGF